MADAQIVIENKFNVQYNILWNTVHGEKEMVHIAICDDEKDFVAYLTGLLNQYAADIGAEIKVTA